MDPKSLETLRAEVITQGKLYRWLNSNRVRANRSVKGSAFTPKNVGISTYWDKHTTPEQCRELFRFFGDPNSIGVLRIGVSDVLAIDGLGLKRTPREFNPPKPGSHGHTDITGCPPDDNQESQRIKLLLAKAARVEIDPPSLE